MSDSAEDAARIRRLKHLREAEMKRFLELKKKTEKVGPLHQFGAGKIHEIASKEETSGLVTKEQYVKSVTILTEEEEKERLEKLQQEKNELRVIKRQKLKKRGNSRLSFSDDINNDEDEDGREGESIK